MTHISKLIKTALLSKDKVHITVTSESIFGTDAAIPVTAWIIINDRFSFLTQEAPTDEQQEQEGIVTVTVEDLDSDHTTIDGNSVTTVDEESNEVILRFFTMQPLRL